MLQAMVEKRRTADGEEVWAGRVYEGVRVVMRVDLPVLPPEAMASHIDGLRGAIGVGYHVPGASYDAARAFDRRMEALIREFRRVALPASDG